MPETQKESKDLDEPVFGEAPKERGYNGDLVDRIFRTEYGLGGTVSAKRNKLMQLPGCCGGFVVCGLSNLTKEEVEERVEEAKKRGVFLFITVESQQVAEKALSENPEVKKLGSFRNMTWGRRMNTIWAVLPQ